VYHSTLGLRVIKKKKHLGEVHCPEPPVPVDRGRVEVHVVAIDPLVVPRHAHGFGVVPARKVDIRLPWKREFTLSWREAGPLNHHDDIVDSDQ